LAVATVALLYLFKGVAWSVSLGSFRGGPVFPAIFLGGVGGLLASNLPGFPVGAAVPAVMAATIAGALRLPLASVLITLLLTASAGAGITPLAIIGMVVSYLIVTRLAAPRGGPLTTTKPPAEPTG
jgi:Ca2+/Na+ antiporter